MVACPMMSQVLYCVLALVPCINLRLNRASELQSFKTALEVPPKYQFAALIETSIIEGTRFSKPYPDRVKVALAPTVRVDTTLTPAILQRTDPRSRWLLRS